MTNPFLASKSARLKEWRFVKKQLNPGMSDMDHLQMIVNWWSPCPISPRVIDPYDAELWPTGWELVFRGEFCQSSIALGMEQTLLLREGRWTNERIKLLLINDNNEDIYLIVLVDDKWILNYSYGEIIDIATVNNIKILMKFIYSSNSHKSY